MDYIEQGYEIENQNSSSFEIINHLTTHHRLQPFHPDYYSPQDKTSKKKFFSYSAENCDATVAFTSKQHRVCPVITSPLSPPSDTCKQVELSELIKFFIHPVRYLMIKKIGIASIEESQSLNTTEPFVVKGLERYKLENDILKHLMEGHDCEKLYQVKRSAGLLPHGKMGEIHFTRTVSAVQSFKRKIDTLFLQNKPQHQEVNLEVNDFKISGRLDNLIGTGMVQYRYATIKPKDIIRSWISHLVLNSINNHDKPESETNTFLAGRDRIYKYTPVSEDSVYLEQLLTLYWQGLSEPLHFFPRTSFVFAREIYKGKSKQEALLKANSEWEGNAYNLIGEKKDPYYSLCFKNMELANTFFMSQAQKIFLPVFEHQTRYTF